MTTMFWRHCETTVAGLILWILILRCFDARNLYYDDDQTTRSQPGDEVFDGEDYSGWPQVVTADRDYIIRVGPERYYTYSRGDDDTEGVQLVGRLLTSHPDSVNPIRRHLSDLMSILRQDLATSSDRLMLRRIPQTSLNAFIDRALKIITHKRGPEVNHYRPPNIHFSKELIRGITIGVELSNILITGTESFHREGDVHLQMTRQGDAFALDATVAYDRLEVDYNFKNVPIETVFGFNVTLLETQQRDHLSMDYIKLHLNVIKLPDKPITLNQVTIDFSEIKQLGTKPSYPVQTIANWALRFLFSGTTLTFQFNMNNSASFGPDETFPRITGGSLVPFVILPLLL